MTLKGLRGNQCRITARLHKDSEMRVVSLIAILSPKVSVPVYNPGELFKAIC